MKTKECKRVLELMDEDHSYSEAIEIVLKDNRWLTKEELEKEVEQYI